MRSWLGLGIGLAALGIAFHVGRTRLRATEVTLAKTRLELSDLRRDAVTLEVGNRAAGLELLRRLDHLENDLTHSEQLHRMTLEEIEAVRRSLSRDPNRMAREVLHPSIQVNGKGSVGGGTIIQCRPLDDGKYATYAVTAFHVVQKGVAKKGGLESREPVEVKLYDSTGEAAETLQSDLVAYDEKKDLALLRLRSDQPYGNVARLAPRATLRDIAVFTPVYAVGCPLGHDPLPSPGEISTLHKEVNGERFWMMNAPTIFGNSGGGIFHRETHELVGISAMICTYDGFVSTPVPHLGIMVSLLTVYDWLDAQYLQFAYDPRFTPEQCERMRQEAARPRASRARIEY